MAIPQQILPSRPRNPVNNTINTAILYSSQQHIISFGSRVLASLVSLPELKPCHHPYIHSQGVFAITWAPHLYHYYVQHLSPLIDFKTYPWFGLNFLSSIFVCATFNFGPALVFHTRTPASYHYLFDIRGSQTRHRVPMFDHFDPLREATIQL